MRLLTITHYSALMGANRSLLHLVTGLRDQYGVEILVLCPKEGHITEALRTAGIPVKVMPFMNWAYTISSLGLLFFPYKWWKYNRYVLPEIEKVAKDFNPDFVHSNSLVVALGWQIAEALQKPHIWHIREFGWQDYRLVFAEGWPLVSQKLKKAKAVICISKAIERLHLGILRGEISQSGTASPEKDTAFAEAKARLHIIYNGIGTAASIRKNGEKGQKSTPDDGLFRYLIIGLLQPAKRQHDALKAFAAVHRKYPNARLVIAGKGQRLYTLRLKLTARLLGIQHAVDFTGYVPQPAPLYAAANVVLMCSHHEAMGRVTAEAMSYGKPVIGYNGSATPELIREGENGWLYNDVPELAEKMEMALLSAEKCHQIGQKGFETALEKFSDERYVAQFYEVLKS